MSTSGTTLAQQAIMEGIALLSSAHHAMSNILKAIDRAETADLANDPDLMTAIQKLKSAKELDPGKNRDGMLAQAERALMDAADKDFGDQSIPAIRALVLPVLKRFESVENDLRLLVVKVSAAA